MNFRRPELLLLPTLGKCPHDLLGGGQALYARPSSAEDLTALADIGDDHRGGLLVLEVDHQVVLSVTSHDRVGTLVARSDLPTQVGERLLYVLPVLHPVRHTAPPLLSADTPDPPGGTIYACGLSRFTGLLDAPFLRSEVATEQSAVSNRLSPTPAYRSSSPLSIRSIRSRSFSAMSPSLKSAGLLDRSKSWPTSSMSRRLTRTNSQSSLRFISSKAQVASTIMCQGSSIPHSWRKREYSRATWRICCPYSLMGIFLPSNSWSDMRFSGSFR